MEYQIYESYDTFLLYQEFMEIPGNSFFSFSSFPALGLDTMMSESSIRLPFARPRAIEPPMFPAPIMAIFIYAYF